ncbi:MAG: single-stranded-DNA-specific exonuclease RecJ [Bacteroidales bacterium]|nr:single-stranded-DNA-specific exonuclease RecJ [Candidatus Colicola coprequi]
MDYTWKIKAYSEAEQQLAEQLATELRISVPAARLLTSRGIQTASEAKTYIRPSLSQLHDPFLMRDMDKAVERITQALARHERILVYGDYDVDGTTAVALMYTYLSSVVADESLLNYYIPDRYTEGYGISFRGIDYAAESGYSLVIALDCGIKAIDKVEYASGKGIDFVICDHHTPGDEIPKAVAVLNMKRADCPYPYKHLSGCGVGFKLVQALMSRHLPATKVVTIEQLLPLLAMSIASDVVPMTGENRVLEYYGLKSINAAPSVGIKAIMQVAGLEQGHVTVNDLLFRFGPRINACGRLYSGYEAVKLLISEDEVFAAEQAKNVDSFNTERKDYDNQTTEEALALLRQDPDNEQRFTTVVYAPHWHKGVVGISASRLTETYYRPTIVLTSSDTNTTLTDTIISGSARSVGGFDIYAAIDSCRDLLTNFGGHQFAAGISLRLQDLPEFRRRFELYVSEHILDHQRQPTISIDQEIAFEDITPKFFSVLRHLEPFGPDNERPVFLTRNVINNRYTKRVGKTGEHLRLDVTDHTAAITGIAFGKGDMALYMQNGKAVDVCYELDENTYNNQTSIQMMVSDIKNHV